MEKEESVLEFGCLRCKESIHISFASFRSHLTEDERAQLLDNQKTIDLNAIRCIICDGLYHTQCLIQCKYAFDFQYTCSICMKRNEDQVPLLVPWKAFELIMEEEEEEKEKQMKERKVEIEEQKVEREEKKQNIRMGTRKRKTSPVVDKKEIITGKRKRTFVQEEYNIPVVEMVTLLICDGCEIEVEVSSETEIPAGDWYCINCLKKQKEKTITLNVEKDFIQEHVQETSSKPCHAVCDGCEQSFIETVLYSITTPEEEGKTFLFCIDCEKERKKKKKGPKAFKGVRVAIPITSSNSSSAVKPITKPPKVKTTKPPSAGKDVEMMKMYSNIIPWKRRIIPSTRSLVDLEPLENLEEEGGEEVADTKKKKKTKIMTKGKKQITKTLSSSSLPFHFPKPVRIVSTKPTEDSLLSSSPIVTVEDQIDLDMESDPILLICDFCCEEFTFIDTSIVESESIPVRPWYCIHCLKRLKKNRRKRTATSKQMQMELDLYGHLLRPTAAKAIDFIQEAKKGKIPTHPSSLRPQFELSGTRLSVLLDAQWIMGRVLWYSKVTGRHLVRSEDDQILDLPLFALPCAIGTTTFVQVWKGMEEWSPAQVLELNAMALDVLSIKEEEQEWCFLVSIFRKEVNEEENGGRVVNEMKWVPKHFCRAIQGALKEEEMEKDTRIECCVVGMRTMVRENTSLWPLFALEWIGVRLESRNKRRGIVEAFDTTSGNHVVRVIKGEREGEREQVNLYENQEEWNIESKQKMAELCVWYEEALKKWS